MRKSAKKILSVFIAALMIVTAIPFTAAAASTDYEIGDNIRPEDLLINPGDIDPSIEIVWTAYTGRDQAFVTNGDDFWSEHAGEVISDYSDVSVAGLTPEQFPSNAVDSKGYGYVACSFILHGNGGQWGNSTIKFGYNPDELTVGTRKSANLFTPNGDFIIRSEDNLYDKDWNVVIEDNASTFVNDDNLKSFDGKIYPDVVAISYGTTVWEDPEEGTVERPAIYVGDTYNFMSDNPDVTIDGFYIATIGFKVAPGTVIGNDLLHFEAEWPEFVSYCPSTNDFAHAYSLLDTTSFQFDLMPIGKLEIGTTPEAPAKEYTVTYKNAEGSEISTEKVTEGNAPAAVPELPANDYDTKNHYSYSWDGDTTAPITGDTTFQVVKNATPHQYTSEVIQNASYTQPEITKYTCDCGYSYTAETAPILSHEHNYGKAVADYTSDLPYDEGTSYTHTATCTAAGECNAPTKTDACTFDDGVVIKQADYGQAEVTKYTCTVCGGTYTKETAPALTHEHNYGEAVADYTSDQPYSEATSYTHTATCTAEGPCDAQTVTSDCTFDAGTVTQKATVDQPEVTTYTCTVCGGTYTKETAPALKGYDVKVMGTDMGTATLNDEAVVGDSLTKKFAVNDTVTLTATPSDTCEFVGWQVGNKIVSTSATYTTIVTAPITYTPVFVDKSAALEFVFLDMFGNVISSQSVSNASEVVMPNDPVYNGYKFTGWSVDADTIHASQESMTITAQFEKDTDANYTVNAEGATISYGDVTAENTLADVPYGTQVTVTKEGATGWQINGADVAYGDSYTFYVASDVTVAPIDTAVTAKPVVAAVSYSQLSNSSNVEFVASRAMTDDCTFIKAGWVYGKNLTDEDLTLDKVGQVGSNADSGVVKAAYVASTEGSTQFILSYGIAAQTGTASAKAFLTYKDAEGAIHTVYSDAMNYTYGA